MPRMSTTRSSRSSTTLDGLTTWLLSIPLHWTRKFNVFNPPISGSDWRRQYRQRLPGRRRCRPYFGLRFWGPITAAQYVHQKKFINPTGSIMFVPALGFASYSKPRTSSPSVLYSVNRFLAGVVLRIHGHFRQSNSALVKATCRVWPSRTEAAPLFLFLHLRWFRF